ncbi:MAG: hypothetical protein IKA28_02690, partial [Tidjanibacter sp.]|nr:hypothetical protein [Tidjanibacter sp.]
AELIVAKHRNGATDVIKMKFRKEFAQFSDFDPLDGTLYNGDREFGSSLDGDGGFGGMDGRAFEALPPTSMGADGSQARGTARSTYEESPF